MKAFQGDDIPSLKTRCFIHLECKWICQDLLLVYVDKSASSDNTLRMRGFGV